MALGGAGAAPRTRALDDVVDWFRRVSGGAWAPRPVSLPPLRLDHALARYSAERGLSTRGANSRDMTAAAIAALGEEPRRQLASAGGRLMLLVPDRFRAHVWYPPRGGIALGQGAWCRQFAVVPASAPLGTVAHEIGHLLANWPDGCASAGRHCLMALGGHAGGGSDPAPPAAPLVLAAGWRRQVPLTATLSAEVLDPGRDPCPARVGTLAWREKLIWAEIRRERLLAWHGPKDRPHLICDIPIKGRAGVPILGLLAPALRRM